MPQDAGITRDEAITQVAAALAGPISLDEFVERVLAIWPTNNKNPKAPVRQTIRDHHLGKTLIMTDKKTLTPIQMALAGAQFRVGLSREELKEGILYVYPAFQYFLPQTKSATELQLVDEEDHIIPTEVTEITIQRQGLLGAYSYKQEALKLGWWFKKLRLSRQDNLLVTILDITIPKFRLQAEPHHEYRHHRKEIVVANQQLADTLFSTLEAERNERIWGSTAVPTAYALLKDTIPYPADHWLEVVKKDPRLRWNGTYITYGDRFSPIENLLLDLEPARRDQRPSRPPKLSKQQKQQVYRFHVAYKRRNGLWRRIEIQGSQTLSDFNDFLVGEFKHDFDHMAGFWKLVRRGQTKNYREIEIATIEPFGGGEGAHTKIAALEMQPGDKMKYVFDFGDWHEYVIELEAIEATTEPDSAPKRESRYPRVVAQNRPHYEYCTDCAEEERKTVAVYLCYSCAAIQGEPVYVCKAHASPEHDDHYLEEVVF